VCLPVTDLIGQPVVFPVLRPRVILDLYVIVARQRPARECSETQEQIASSQDVKRQGCHDIPTQKDHILGLEKIIEHLPDPEAGSMPGGIWREKPAEESIRLCRLE
jgi:hypothetical protein